MFWKVQMIYLHFAVDRISLATTEKLLNRSNFHTFKNF